MSEELLLKILALEYTYTQGLHVEKNDLIRKTNINEETLDTLLKSLESKELVSLYRDKKGRIKLAKITWKGLNYVSGIKLKFDKRRL